jgi:hypothetical protein
MGTYFPDLPYIPHPDEDEIDAHFDDLDGLDIPDKDIEYQEDDGNSNCDDGGCTI